MSVPNPDVDAFVSRAKRWRSEIQKLRPILRECGLDEDLKWGKPCYTFDGKNVAIVQPFKDADMSKEVYVFRHWYRCPAAVIIASCLGVDLQLHF